MNVDLTPELEQIVQTQLNSGRYISATEVVQEALRLLEQRDEAVTLRKGKIRDQIEEGWQSAKFGEFVDGDEVFDRIDAELDVMERAARRFPSPQFVLSFTASASMCEFPLSVYKNRCCGRRDVIQRTGAKSASADIRWTV